ncbi:MAG: ATPase [Calditrichaeota bacterium]|nr:MAG: ATPase [Calditrichota bacterium]
MSDAATLREKLRNINGRGYKAYRELSGVYQLGPVVLYIDHVQGDPFAAPSRLRLRVDQPQAAIPTSLFEGKAREIACRDFLARRFAQLSRRYAGKIRGTGHSGQIYIDAGGQKVLERTAACINRKFVELRLQVGLPASGRTILGREAERLLLQFLPDLAEHTLLYKHLPHSEMQQFVDCVDNQEYLRAQLEAHHLVAFVANGAILPRESGVSDRPMAAQRAVAFRSPQALEVELPLRHPLPGSGQTSLRGMGVSEGIHLIVGGGYHGKSTLLKALQDCVYPHIPGDGREFVVSHPAMVKIRAEDGRAIEQVDISPFISHLPLGQDTRSFSTEDASGSTSQAANILEALEVGARVLLLDEDTCATNLMIRDARMQALVEKAHEPITPFLDRVGELYRNLGVSTILVMGGSGDYLDVATRVIKMQAFVPEDVTEQAREVARRFPVSRKREVPSEMRRITRRVALPESLNPARGKKAVAIEARGLEVLDFGRQRVDLRAVEQLVDVSQTRAIGYALLLLKRQVLDGGTPLDEAMEALEKLLNEHGLDALNPAWWTGGPAREHHPGNFARPRRFEVAAALNRLRSLRVRQLSERES